MTSDRLHGLTRPASDICSGAGCVSLGWPQVIQNHRPSKFQDGDEFRFSWFDLRLGCHDFQISVLFNRRNPVQFHCVPFTDLTHFWLASFVLRRLRHCLVLLTVHEKSRTISSWNPDSWRFWGCVSYGWWARGRWIEIDARIIRWS